MKAAFPPNTPPRGAFLFANSLAMAFLVACLLLSVSGLHAETYHVAPNGNDDALGTQEFPWQTIQKAFDELEPGDTAIMHPGFYNEQLYVEVEGNEEDGYVTFQAEPGAVITAQGLSSEDNVIYIEDKSWIRIIGFEIRDLQTKDGSGIRFEGSGSHLEFRNNVIHAIHGKSAMGITVYGTNPDEPVSQVIIDGNEIHDCDTAPSEALVLNGNVTNFEVTNNHVHDIRGVGIDFIGGEDGIVDDDTGKKVARNGLCRGNRVERVRAPYGGGYGPGIYVDGGTDIRVEANHISECDLGLEVGAENPGVLVSGISVVGNVITGNDKAGLVFGGYDRKRGRVTGCRFLNNLIHDNTSHAKAEAEVWIQWAEANVFRNNIVVGRADSKKSLLSSENRDQSNDFDFNLWFQPGADPENTKFVWGGKTYQGFAAFRDSTGLGARSYPVDPKLADDGLHLSPDSPAIDAGDPGIVFPEGATDLDGQPRVQGSAPDLGPDEVR
ncbi:MAG: right-handed parallel beta-helix repeat-containing protein [Verrucomicrobiae bacterium]|nr:right-handed parallel beta-helix repeat-containing protein [Verrucomicrobiae bacterium]